LIRIILRFKALVNEINNTSFLFNVNLQKPARILPFHLVLYGISWKLSARILKILRMSWVDSVDVTQVSANSRIKNELAVAGFERFPGDGSDCRRPRESSESSNAK
jgi:hypothetical protein